MIKRHFYLFFLGTLLIISFIIFFAKLPEAVDETEENHIKANIIEKQDENNGFLRFLDFISSAEKICNRSSQNLVKFYQTKDPKYAKFYELDPDPELSETIKDLISILDEKDSKKQKELLRKYVKRYIITLIIYSVFAIVSIVVWIAFGVFCCCNCRCFPCCLKSKCILPFFIVSSIMNLLAIISVLIGLFKIKKLLKGGLANAECSILSFINEGIEGESKRILPKWGGIFAIKQALNNTKNKLKEIEIQDNSEAELYNETKTQFENYLIDKNKIIRNELNYLLNYLDNDYILDLADEFGVYNYSSKEFTQGSFCDLWSQETPVQSLLQVCYSLVTFIGNGLMTLLDYDIDYVNKLYNNIEDIKNLIGDEIVKYADKIDKYGKIVFFTIFTFLLFISVILQILLILYIFLCRGKTFMKVLIHIFWYILVLLLVITFLVAAFCTLVSNLGSDILEMINYILSKKNLESEEPLIFSDGTILNICINGDGDLAKFFKLTEFFDILEEAKSDLKSLNDESDDSSWNKTDAVFELILKKLEERRNLEIKNFGFIKINNSTSNSSSENLLLDSCVSNLNQEIESCSIKERWSFSCKSEFPDLEEHLCDINYDDKCMDPSTCRNGELVKKYENIDCTKPKEISKVVDRIFSSVGFAANKSENNSIINQAENISEEYISFLNKNENFLKSSQKLIYYFIAIFDSLVGEKPITSFLNCSFLKEDIEVTLHFLKYNVIKKSRDLEIISFLSCSALFISIGFIIAIISITNKTTNSNSNDKFKNNKDISKSTENSFEKTDDEIYK